MIKIDNGTVEAEGTFAKMCMELSIIIKALRKRIAEVLGEEFAENKISEAFENSKLSYEEIVNRFIDGKRESTNTAAELLKILSEEVSKNGGRKETGSGA